MHRSPGFNPPEKESTRTSTVDCAAAGRFKEEHRRENKNRDIYIYLPSFKVYSKFFSKRLFTLFDIHAHVVIWRGKIRVDILYIYTYIRGIKRGNLWTDDEFENEFMELKKLFEKGLLKGC